MLKCVFSTFLFLTTLSASAADIYKIDTKESSVTWKGSKKMGSFHTGGIAVKDGQVEVDKKNQITAGTFSIDMATISNEDLKGSPDFQKKLVGHLSSDDFFSISKFPTSTFKILSIAPGKAKDEVTVKGELTIIGKTNPIEFPAKVTIANGVAKGDAQVKVDRTKWGLKYGSGNFFKELTADKVINDEFELNLKLVAKK